MKAISPARKAASSEAGTAPALAGPSAPTPAGAPATNRGAGNSSKRIRRPYQNVALVAVREVRQLGLDWARRCRKSTTLGEIGFDQMSIAPGRMVIGASASLLLGRELTGMALTAVEQAAIVAQEAAAVRATFESGAEAQGLQFKIAEISDKGKDKEFAKLNAEDFANLYQSRRMELRLYFDRAAFSRMQVIAPNPATCRSWRGTVLFDEFGYIPSAQASELRIAADPMMRDTPDLKMIYACNLPLDDRHPWFEMTMPREISAATEEDQFPPNPDGHLYIGQQGILIHRVALKDAYEAGHRLYDDYGAAMTYEQCRAFPQFRGGWDISYALNHKPGGAAVIDLIALVTAMRRGAGQCAFIYADSDADFRRGMESLRASLKDGLVGIGVDVASTTAELSNPTSITVTERQGIESFQRLVLVFKTKKRQVRDEWLRRICEIVRSRPEGGPVKRLCIDASNERLSAEETADDLAAIVPVQLVINSNVVDPRPPGYSESDGNVNYKTYLGDLYAARVNDARVNLPPDDYIKTDHRLTMKDAGRFVCIPDPLTGAHGDTFDSGKLAEFALSATAGAISDPSLIHIGSNAHTPRFTPKRVHPHRRIFA